MASLPSPSSWHNDVAATDSTTNTSPEEVRMCWVCQDDYSADDPREWRSPCPCSASAHHECLLTWIARRPDPSAPIECPICKVEIKTNESHVGPFVAASEWLESICMDVLAPSVLVASLGGILYSGFLVYGTNTVFAVFGEDKALQILAPTTEPLTFLPGVPLRALLERVTMILTPFSTRRFQHMDWKLAFGLPLLAPTLILARTSVVDRLFVSLPLLELVRRLAFEHDRAYPAYNNAIVYLPYIREAYLRFYAHAFRPLERRWDAAIQHRTLEEGQEDTEAQPEQQRGGWDLNFDLDFQLGFGGPGEDAPQAQPDAAPVHVDLVIDPDVPLPDILEAAARPEVPDPVPNPPPANRNRRLNGSILSTIVGGLLFPFLSSNVGSLLRFALPSRYFTRSNPFFGIKAGLLHQQWARTFVGGALLVVMRDVAVLTYKWRKASRMEDLKVLDYTGPRHRGAGTAGASPSGSA